MNELFAIHETKTDAGAWAVLDRAQACIAHRTAGRLRLKVPGRRHDAAFFADLERELVAQPGIVSVQANPMTASILVVHDGTLDPCGGQGWARQGAAAPSYNGAGLASLAIKLALVAVTHELGLPLVELCADAVAHSVLRGLTQPTPQRLARA